MEEKCNSCGEKFIHGISANMIVFCPHCRKTTGSVSDYGFGPITPCDIYLGDQIVGHIIGRNSGEYRLVSDHFGLDMKLSREYKELSVYHEAEDVIEKMIRG